MSRTAAVLTSLVLIVLPSLAREQVARSDMPALAQGNNQFAFDLYGKLQADKGNLFYSPYSISTALAMTSAGAKGETLAQMNKTLHLDLGPDRVHAAFHQLITSLNGDPSRQKFELSTANALWVAKNYPVVPAFLAHSDADYQAKLQQVDFAGDPEKARLTINRWVEERTRNKIQNLLESGALDADTRLVLTNAIYFKGEWANPFNTKATQKGEFRLPNAAPLTDVSLMHKTEELAYAETDDVQLVELPYAGGRLSMVVLLPKKLDGLAALEKDLTAANVSKWLAKLQANEVNLTLPKFQMTAKFELEKTLSALGMPLAFTTSADFSGICTSEKLAISKVIHKAFIDVDEKGTEAAAATAVVLARPSEVKEPPPVKTFQADHPFVFLLRDHTTQSILFLGRVINPKGT
jgi:serpin B